MNVKLRINLLLNRIVEFIKYDYNHLKYPLVLASHGIISLLQKLNKHSLAFKVASNIYRTGWAKSEQLGLSVALYYFKLNPSRQKEDFVPFLKNQYPG